MLLNNMWCISPFMCCSSDECILPCLLCSNIRIHEDLYFRSWLGIWSVQNSNITLDSISLFLTLIMCKCCEKASPCNYGFGVGPIGYTRNGNCYPLWCSLNYKNIELFNRIICFGCLYKDEKKECGCSSLLPIYLKKYEMELNGKKIIEKRGINYLLPWKSVIME
jgi:hypothetical protein